RYYSGGIYVGVAQGLGEVADSYAALEWSRFEREWGRVAAPTGERGTPARRPESPQAPAPTEQAGHGAEPLSPPPTATPAPPHRTDKTPVPPAPTPTAEADHAR